MNIVTVFPSFENKGGAEDVAISLALELKYKSRPIVLHLGKNIFSDYQASGVTFEKFCIHNIKQLHERDAVFLSHHRKTTTYLILLSKIFFRGRLRIIHVAHNIFTSLKRSTLFPKHNIAVSNAVRQNMMQYFKLPENRINVIYNGIKDHFDPENQDTFISSDSINILFLGRIDPVKQQVEFVRKTKGSLKDNIRIYFAGIGSDYENLTKAIVNDFHYITLGLINPYQELPKYDYVCLFSQKEGLPLSLIEAQMFAKPLITNDILPCIEINKDNETGFVCHSWTEVINRINSLPKKFENEYQTLSANSRKSFESNFDFNIMIESYRIYINSIKW